LGFGSSKRSGDDTEAINRMFTPEFRNRLDAVIPFSGLPLEVILKVVEKFVFQLEAQLADRGVTIELGEDAAKWLAEKGYDEKFGARPLARVIQYSKKPLADELLFGKLEHGGTVRRWWPMARTERRSSPSVLPRRAQAQAKDAGSDDDDDEDEQSETRHSWSRPAQALSDRRKEEKERPSPAPFPASPPQGHG
jgi:ATP-dependent Clp protease ATP-binding subunit ClpA